MGRIARAYTPIGPIRDLFDSFEDAHIRSGEPSVRELAAKTGLAVGTVHNALKGPVVPPQHVVEVMAIELGIGSERGKELHHAAATEVRDRGLPPGAFLLSDMVLEARTLLNEMFERAGVIIQDQPDLDGILIDRELRRLALRLDNLTGPRAGWWTTALVPAMEANPTHKDRVSAREALDDACRDVDSFPLAKKAHDFTGAPL